MRVLHTFDDKDYSPGWPKFSREAVRGIFIKSNKIALVRSGTEGFYKFPGGGVQPGESHIHALAREAREETGLCVIAGSVREFGMIHELRKGLYGEETFDQKSYYYHADILDEISAQNLDDYEKDYQFELAWTDIETAYRVNTELYEKTKNYFIQREAYVLKLL